GKKLAVTQTELRLVFKTPPKLGFGLRGAETEPDQLVIRLDPNVGIRFKLEAHHAGTGPMIQPIHLDMEFANQGGEGATPYEVLLHAAMSGQTLRFTRQDAVDEQWRIMQPLLDAPPPVESYAPGTWGPEGAARLLSGQGHWYEPRVAWAGSPPPIGSPGSTPTRCPTTSRGCSASRLGASPATKREVARRRGRSRCTSSRSSRTIRRSSHRSSTGQPRSHGTGCSRGA